VTGTIRYRLPLDKNSFKWQGTGEGNFTVNSLNTSHVRVNHRRISGGNVLSSVGYVAVAGQPTLQIEFVREFVNTGSTDFEFEIWLSDRLPNNVAADATRFYVYGTFANKYHDNFYGDETYVHTGDGQVIRCTEFSRNVEIDAGRGVTLFMNLLEDTRYYVRADMNLSDADQKIMDEIAAIEGIITMRTAATRHATFRSAKVELDLGDSYFVYGENYEFLGMSDERLPFSNKYFLATSRIDLGTQNTPAPSEEEPVVPPDAGIGTGGLDNPGTGGTSAPVNANDNPGTGR